jgi:CspA family cold shock protein
MLSEGERAYVKIRSAQGNAGDWEPGRVQWFNRIRGYGFVDHKAGPPAFLHAEVLRYAGLVGIRHGAQVDVRVGTCERGPIVVEIRPAS